MPWFNVKTGTLLETENRLGKPPEKHCENNLKSNQKTTKRTVLAIAFDSNDSKLTKSKLFQRLISRLTTLSVADHVKWHCHLH